MAFKSIFSLFSSDLAIDLGTANTLVFAKGRGIVVSEPSIVAINKITNAVEAVGREVVGDVFEVRGAHHRGASRPGAGVSITIL